MYSSMDNALIGLNSGLFDIMVLSKPLFLITPIWHIASIILIYNFQCSFLTNLDLRFSIKPHSQV